MTTEDKERISIDAEEYVSNLFGTDADGAWRRNAAKDYIAGATAEHERLEKDQDYIDLKETIGSAQQELQAYRDIIKLADLALSTIKLEPTMSGSVFGNFDRRLFISRRADFYDSYQKLLPLIDTVTPT